jgi:hypothetical protein
MSDPRPTDPFAELFGSEPTPTPPAPTADLDALLGAPATADPVATAEDLNALFGTPTASAPGDDLFSEAIASDVGAGSLTEIATPDYGVGGGRETGMDARGILAEIDSEGDLFTDLFGEAPLTPEVAAAIADPDKIVVRTVSATARDDEKVAEEIELVAERAPGRLSRLWHWTLGWPARPHDPRYVLPRLARRLAVVGGLPLLVAAAIGASSQGSLYPESGNGRFGMLWTSGFGVVKAATIPTVTIDGIAVEPGAAAEAARLTAALWPALIAAGADDLAPLREIATETFVAGYPAWLAANGLADGAFVAVDEQLSSGRGLLMSVDLPEAPTRLTVAAPGGIAVVTTPTASGPFYLASLRLTVVRSTDGGYRIDQVELLR